MKDIRPEILHWLDESIIPRYDAFDKGHQRDHAHYVINTALELSRYYDVNREMIAVAAACHDLGLSIDRKTHHLESGRMIRGMNELRGWFSPEQIETIAQAAEDHRASSDHEPRTIYGKIIAEADRQIIPETVIRRTVQYGMKNHPDNDKEGHWQRMLEHLDKKYAEGGYLKLWIPESPNAARLENLRAIIRDRKALRDIFDKIYESVLTRKLVIFDLDGTLLNTIEDLGRAVNGALENNGIQTHPIKDYYRMVGGGVKNLVKRSLPDTLKDDEDTLERVLSDFFICYRASIDRFTRPYPGITDLLRRLQKEGYLLAVASNKFQDGVSALISKFFPDTDFVSVLGNKPDAPLKPSPSIVYKIIGNCVVPVKAIMVGDSGIDITTAKAADIPVIAVSWGFRSREELSDADRIADDAEALYAAIAEL